MTSLLGWGRVQSLMPTAVPPTKRFAVGTPAVRLSRYLPVLLLAGSYSIPTSALVIRLFTARPSDARVKMIAHDACPPPPFVSVTSLLSTWGPAPTATIPKAWRPPRRVLPPVATTSLLRMVLPRPSTHIPLAVF